MVLLYYIAIYLVNLEGLADIWWHIACKNSLKLPKQQGEAKKLKMNVKKCDEENMMTCFAMDGKWSFILPVEFWT